MWATKKNNWNIVDSTPYAKDVLKPLADECHKQGIKLFFYHSHLDWHSTDYYPLGRTGHASGRPPAETSTDISTTWMRNSPSSSLITVTWPVSGSMACGTKPYADWRLRRTYDLIHKLQPAALVGNNHHLAPFEGEDFQMFERDLPGKNTTDSAVNRRSARCLWKPATR